MRRRRKKQKPSSSPIMQQGIIMPWLFVLPALAIIFVYVAYPTIYTFILSLQNKNSTDWAVAACLESRACWGIFENYRYAFTSEVMLRSFRNNALWLIFMVPGVTAIGLLVAVLVDKIRYENLAKAIIFMPMAISFVGAGVIWGFVYDFPINPDNPNSPIIGILNAVLVALGRRPIPFLASPPLINNLSLIVVGIWLYTGFSMTILSAAIKGINQELLEAARIDGANEWQVFWQVMFPVILPTITVVMTTMTLFSLKLFGVVYVMTGGNFGTNVVAVRMYQEMYVNFETGRSAAIAVILLVMIIPVLVYNIRRFREQEAMR